jgi:hypothetical protein
MPKQVDETIWTHVSEWQFNESVFDRKYWLDTETGCHQWLGASGPQGALFGVKKLMKPRMIQARRIAWMRLHKEDITGFELRHTCHNNMCVNPEHMTKHVKQARRPRT